MSEKTIFMILFFYIGVYVMKKFFRNLFSGYFLVLLILVIELIAFVIVNFFMDDIVNAVITSDKITSDGVRIIIGLVYLLLRVVIFFIAFFIFFKIVNKPEDPEFKIPWIVVMLLMPLFASIMFIIFVNHGLRKIDLILVDASRADYNAHF